MFRAHTCTMSCKLSFRTCPSSTTYLFQCSENHDFSEFGMQNNGYWYAQIFYKFSIRILLSKATSRIDLYFGVFKIHSSIEFNILNFRNTNFDLNLVRLYI